MLIRKPNDIPSSEITDEHVYLNRRKFIARAGGIGLAAAAGLAATPLLACAPRDRDDGDDAGSAANPDDKLTPYEDITTYNNFYEFGTDKSDPSENAKNFRTRPWSVAVEGLVRKPAVYQIEDILKMSPLEERVYRFRCVEAWSMVIPWLGFPLSDLIKRV